jgi:hypothetical protein
MEELINDEVKKEYKPFDLFFMRKSENEFLLQQGNTPLLFNLMTALKFYFKVEVTLDFDNRVINIGDTGVVNRDNFEEMCDIIMKINDREKQEVEKPPVFQNERQKDIYEKIMAGRKRQQQRDQINIATMINTIVHGGRSFIPYREVMKMTFWQMLNSYKAVLTLDNWAINYPVMTVQIDPKGMDLSHWSKLIKI